MKVLVTGASGFIGSHLVELLIENNFDVKAFIHYNSFNNIGNLQCIDKIEEIELFKGDIRDYDSVSKALEGCTTVFHLAALIGIPYSYYSPLAYIRTNIEGTYDILEACKRSEAEQIILTSTSETYGTAQYVPIDEKHPLVGQSPYSATKIAADQLAISYYRSFEAPIKILRPFNNYGPRQSERAIIPTIITQILKGNKKIELGKTAPTRDFLYVKDSAHAFYELYKSNKLFGEVVNAGTNNEISISSLVEKILTLTKADVEIVQKENRFRPVLSEVERLKCDNSKIISNTNWKPIYSLSEGLMETINWVQNNLDKFNPNEYNV